MRPDRVYYRPMHCDKEVKMATIKAFGAIRPDKDLAHRIAALPYDVMTREEAVKMAEEMSIPS